MKEAYLYDKLENNKVRCVLCNHKCLIKNGQKGLCGVRENRSGTLVSLVYGKVIASHCDPIEKKPLFHVLPASRSYSIATVGCNFRCVFCQNYPISQLGYGQTVSVERLAARNRISVFEIPLLSVDRAIHDRMSASTGAFDRATLAMARTRSSS